MSLRATVRADRVDAGGAPSGEQRCPECNSAVAQQALEHTCIECGLVIDEYRIDHGPEWRRGIDDKRERCYPADPDRADRGLGSVTPQFTPTANESARAVAHRNKVATRRASRKSRNRSYTTTEIERITGATGLPDTVSENAKRVFRAWHSSESLQGRNLDRVAAACVLYSARAIEAGISAEEILNVSRVEHETDLRTCLYALADDIGVGVRPPTPQARLKRLAATVDFDVDSETRLEAHRLLDGLHSDRSPTTLAAAALYLAGGGGGVGRGANGHWTQEEIAYAMGVSVSSIQDGCKEIRRAGR